MYPYVQDHEEDVDRMWHDHPPDDESANNDRCWHCDRPRTDATHVYACDACSLPLCFPGICEPCADHFRSL